MRSFDRNNDDVAEIVDELLHGAGAIVFSKLFPDGGDHSGDAARCSVDAH